MTSDAAARAWGEAQRLLVERGPWTTEGGAYLESDEVTVLIHPVFDDADGRSLQPGAVDVVITVRPRLHRHLPAGAGVHLVGPAGHARSEPLGARGQAVFHQLPVGEWSAQLVVVDPTTSAPKRGPLADVIPLRSFSRQLPAAAGGEERLIGGTYASLDGRLTTEVVETPEARLVVRISAADPPDAVVLVRLRWALVAPGLDDRTETLVVPLAPSGDGGEMMAKYDLGSVDKVQAVRIGPAEWAEPADVTAELVRRAFGFSLYGSARRAWEQLAASGVCAPATQSALLEMLER
ncbi:MAG: hypothetical protein ABR540_15550 [Acidimicrobiales bacterium]